jgi:D-3-phosphoglycerate dehydrogenase
MKQIFIALSSFAQDADGPLKLLKHSGHGFTANTSGRRVTKEEVIAQAKDADAIIAGIEPYDAEVLASLPRLKCISRCGVGVDNIDLKQAKARGIVVLNTPDAVVQPVAELTLAMILDLLRQVTAYTELMRQKKWQRLTGAQLAGKKVGIIGLGRIGRRVAGLLQKLDVKVCGYDIAPDLSWARDNGVELLGLHDLLNQSDIVTLHLTAVDENPFCLGHKEFQHMKKGAFLINVARGSLVNEEALVSALKEGHLAGAALDVYVNEPYTGPLCGLANVILTPHVGTFTKESRLDMETQAVQNLLQFFKGS